MPFLYEKIDTLREVGVQKELPQYMQENLNRNFELRPYQIKAFENFITYFESDKLCQKPTQTLFHMATGSGKTLIMAGLILYLYKQGYRNFLFFVNLSNIVRKTKDNFLKSTSSKYLFAEEIAIDGEKVPIKEVTNFQYCDDKAVNICFTTTQGLHSDMWGVKENALSVDDFANKKVVLISDEAHHLNADTKKMSKDEEVSYKSWEYTVHRIFCANRDNVLLEFTATCDIKNPLIKAEYENKIIFDYPLYKFRADRYSKEIKTLRSDLNIEQRALQALILSQYRYKVFQDCRQNVKPVVFFQSRLVKENTENMYIIINMVKNLSGEKIRNLLEQSTNNPVVFTHKMTIGQIAKTNYAIVYKALCKYNVFKFNLLKSKFPNLTSTREFILNKNYLGEIEINIKTQYEKLTPQIMHNACVRVLGKIAESVTGIVETYEGSSEFSAKYIHDIFKDKRCNYTQLHKGGIGYSQNDESCNDAGYRMDLSKEDWFVFGDNYGTGEEKAFVAYFEKYVRSLKEKYDKVYLIRNERQLAIYSFDGGERFEPDYLLFLHSPKQNGYEQLQVFIEPKGEQLISKDSWKEKFLMQLEAKAVPFTEFADDNKYRILGFHFFNRNERMEEFKADMGKLASQI